jgi:excisionase family DNA binding protein
MGDADLTRVEPGKLYTTADAAALFGVTPATVRAWVRARQVVATRLPGDRIRILGAVVIARLGETGKVLPGPSETRAERTRRAKAAWDEIAAL